jgi:tRNA pseudouridine55 synthase
VSSNQGQEKELKQTLSLDPSPLPLPSHGFLILDKPLGISSAKAVSQVKNILGCKKIGHGGTLDPLASGVLPLAIGEATKTFDYVASAIKEYCFTVTFGEERDTGDSEGAITATTPELPSKEVIGHILPEFIGTIMQVPPVYSALKINGERAYKRAREGERVEMAARPVQIHKFELVSSISANGNNLASATFNVACGKGTYVRSLAKDIAIKCNSLGYVSMLRRVSVGKFHENKAISLDKLEELVHNAALFEAWIPIELALDDIPAINMESEQVRMLRHGKTLETNKSDGKYMALYQGKIVALVECMQGRLTSLRGFNL